MCNKDLVQTEGVLGRLVDESGEMKEPSHCIIQYGGRVRLPDKLMEILNKEFEPEAMWWQPDGECFAFDSETVQKKILDVWFRGTKLTSFIRSLNRWGFRRVFYHALPESALAFHHASFRKTSTPDMLKSMKMSKSGKTSASAAAIAATKAGEQGVPEATPSLNNSLFSQSIGSPLNNANQRLSQLPAPNSPEFPSTSLSMLPQLASLSSMSSSSVSSFAQQQQSNNEALLNALSEQRNRDLLALTGNTTGRRSSAVDATTVTSSTSAITSNLQRALLVERQRVALQQAGQQQQLLMLARARLSQSGQDLRQQQEQRNQQRQQTDSALQMALLALKSRSSQSVFSSSSS